MHLNVCNIGCSACELSLHFFTFCSTLDYWIRFFKMKGTTLCGWTQRGVKKVTCSKPCAFIHLSYLGFLWSLYNPGLSPSWLFKYCNKTLYSACRIISPSQQSVNTIILHFNPFVTSKWMCKIKLPEKATFRHSSWPLRANSRARAFPKHSALWHTVPSLTSIFTGDPMIIVFSWMFSLNSGEWSLTSSTVINTSAKLYFPSVSSAFT